MATASELRERAAKLRKEADQIEKQIAQAIEEEKLEAIASIFRTMNAFNITVDDLKNPPKVKVAKRKPSNKEPIYRSLIDPTLVAFGKGPKPEWMVTYLENGGDIEKLKIANQKS